jgi:hypothetical protein
VVTYRQAKAPAFQEGSWWMGRDGSGEVGVVEVNDDGTFGRFAFKLGDTSVVATPDNQGTGPFYSTRSLRLT